MIGTRNQHEERTVQRYAAGVADRHRSLSTLPSTKWVTCPANMWRSLPTSTTLAAGRCLVPRFNWYSTRSTAPRVKRGSLNGCWPRSSEVRSINMKLGHVLLFKFPRSSFRICRIVTSSALIIDLRYSLNHPPI
jgi:hypothetical protein